MFSLSLGNSSSKYLDYTTTEKNRDEDNACYVNHLETIVFNALARNSAGECRLLSVQAN
jgi:hypothetical protein